MFPTLHAQAHIPHLETVSQVVTKNDSSKMKSRCSDHFDPIKQIISLWRSYLGDKPPEYDDDYFINQARSLLTTFGGSQSSVNHPLH